MKMGDLTGSIDDYTRVIALDTQNVQAFYQRGKARQTLGDGMGAIADYTETLRLNPRSADAIYARATLMTQVGQPIAAKADFQQAATLYLQQGKAEGYRSVLNWLKRI